MLRKRAVAMLLGAGLFVGTVGCEPGENPFLFFEPMNDFTGESEVFPIIRGSNQAAGPDQLGPLANRSTSARYNLTERFVPFMLTGDIAAGTDIGALSLPAVPEGQPDATTFLPSFPRWSSFRVVDRGDCSFLVGWQTIADQLSGEIVNTLNDDDRVIDADLVRGELTPRLKSRIRTPQYPQDIDEIDLTLEVAADRIERGDTIGCDGVEMTIDFHIALDQTDFAWFLVDTLRYARFCGRAHLVTDPETGDQLLVAEPSFLDEIEAGEVPDCDASLDGLPLGEVDAVRFLSELSGRSSGGTLLGYEDIGLNRFDAHDILARVIDVNIPDLAGDCTDFVKDGVRRGIRNAFRDELPLGLRDAILEVTLVDPVFGINDSSDHRPCSIFFDDCGFPADPAYQGASGDWRGARHQCRERDPERAARFGDDAEMLVDLLDDGRFCHIQLEPDRLNVRPDGLELVFADDRNIDWQQAFYTGTLLEDQLCDADRPGAPLEAGRRPDIIADSSPFVVEP